MNKNSLIYHQDKENLLFSLQKAIFAQILR